MKEYPNLLKKRLGPFLILYNPLCVSDILVLNPDAQKIYHEIIRTKRTQNLQKLGYQKSDIQNTTKTLRKAKIIYSKKKSPLLFPESKKIDIWLQTSNRCNLACPYCYIRQDLKTMTVETGKRAIDQLVSSMLKHQYKELVLKFAGGEPTLRKNFVEKISQYAFIKTRAAGLKTQLVLVTNGTLIDQKWCQFLKKHRFRVGISLDAWGKINDKTRIFKSGAGTFNRIKTSLDLLKKNKVHFNIEAVLNSKNAKEIMLLAKRAFEKYNNILFINLLRTSEMKPPQKEDLKLDPKKMVLALKKIISYYKRKRVKEPIYNAILALINFEKPRQFYCASGDTFAAIDPRGNVSHCHMQFYRKDFNISDGDFIDNLQKSSKKLEYKVSVDEKGGCQDCQWRYICCSGCPREDTTSFNQKSPYCQIYQSIIPELIELEASRLINYSE